MCVIMFAENKRPTPEMIEKAYTRNDDGGGIAWRAKNEETGEIEVNWQKGLSLENMQKLAAEVPLPAILHFRIASVGGPLAHLTHPFPVDQAGRNYIAGKTRGYVLFHNGHYNDWKKDMKEAALRYGKKIPDGKWSDTRAMAWICSMAGINYMEMIEEKGIAFSPKAIELFWGGGWYKVGDVWCSNTYWTNVNLKKDPNNPTGAYGNGPSSTYGNPAYGVGVEDDYSKWSICLAPKCQVKENLDDDGYCPQHTKNRPVFEDADLADRGIIAGNQKPNMTLLPNEEDDVTQSGGSESDSPLAQWEMATKNYVSGAIGTRKWKRARRAYETHLRANGMDNDIPDLYRKPNRGPLEMTVS